MGNRNQMSQMNNSRNNSNNCGNAYEMLQSLQSRLKNQSIVPTNSTDEPSLSQMLQNAPSHSKQSHNPNAGNLNAGR